MINNKFPVEISETQKSLDIFDIFGYWLFLDFLRFL